MISNQEDKEYNDLYIYYFNKLYKYGIKFTKDKSLIQDSIQDVFADLWQNRHKRAGINSPESYIFSAFRYTLFKKIKQAGKLVTENSNDSDPEFSPEDFLIARQSSEAKIKKLKESITILTARQREAIYLRFYVGLSYEEVAKILDISVKATYKIMARSLAALKDYMLITISYVLFFF